MIFEMWLAMTWFLYSYDPSRNQTDVPAVSQSQCMPSCLVANSILSNIANEKDPALDGVKCSFLSFMYEMCWDVNPGSNCRPAVDQRIHTMASYYRNTCLNNSCYALFSLSSATDTSLRMKCAPYFDKLMENMAKANCKKHPLLEQRERELHLKNFRDCAELQARSSCKNETVNFINTFASHLDDICPNNG